MKDFPKQIDFDAYAAGICQAYMSAGREATHFAGPTQLITPRGNVITKAMAARWLHSKAPDPTGIVNSIRRVLREAGCETFATWREVEKLIVATQPETLEYVAERYKRPLQD